LVITKFANEVGAGGKAKLKFYDNIKRVYYVIMYMISLTGNRTSFSDFIVLEVVDVDYNIWILPYYALKMCIHINPFS